MAGASLNPAERIIESVRALTNNKTLYGAYKTIKGINQSPLKPVPKAPGIGASGGVAGTAAATGGASTGTPSDVANVSGSVGGAQSRSSLEALNKIHTDLTRMNVTVEKISAFTALLVRNSIISLANQNLSNANATARINEHAINTQGSGEGSGEGGNASGAKKEGGSSILGDVAKGAAGSAAWSAAKSLFKGGIRAMATPIGGAIATVVATAVATKVVSNWMLDFPDGPAKDLVLKLRTRKVISWGWTELYPKILDVSYLRSLPKDQIALLIDCGKFSGQDLGALKVILHEPQTKTKIPATQPQTKTKAITPITPDQHKEPDLKDTTIRNLGPSFDHPNTTNEPIIADDLQTNINPDEIASEKPVIEAKTQNEPNLAPEGNGFNTTETNPELQIPIEKDKEKNLNFGAVAIKSLNIKELIFPDELTIKKLIIEDFNSEKKDKKDKEDKEGFFTKLGDRISKFFSPHDQRPPGYHEEEEGKKTTGPTKKFSEGVEQAITDASKETGVDAGYMRTMAKIESGGDPNAKNASGAKGLYQFVPGTAKEYGIEGKEYDPKESALAAAKLTLANKKQLEGSGIEATPEMLYMAHQQGAAGTAKLSKMSRAGEGWDDLDNKQKSAMLSNGGKEGMSPSEFIAMWDKKYKKAAEGSQDIQVAKKDGIDDGHGNKLIPYNETNTASLEKQQTQSSGNVLNDAQSAQSQVTKAPDLSEDNLKRIADQASKPQAPIIVQAPAAPAQQKATTAPIMAVRDDSPMILNMQYGNLRAS